MVINGKVHGKDHWACKYPFELVEKVRDEYEDENNTLTIKEVAEKHGVPARTARDWVQYRNRNYG